MAERRESRAAEDAPKQAACLSCRKSKMKCIRSSGDATCRKCLQRGSKCIIPEYHIGRHKGVKNKRSGLDKAVYQIEQALHKSKSKGDALAASGLEDLLERTQQMLPGHASEQPVSDLVPAIQIQQDRQSPRRPSSRGSHSAQPLTYTVRETTEHQPARSVEVHNLSVNDAENPLQLLAQTSELLLTPRHSTPAPAAGSASSMNGGSSSIGQPFSQAFFSRLRSRLDNESELDPVELGLTTVPEADVLFTFFYQHLSHTRWGLDPEIYTSSFVRGRSNFLFTAIISASALFLPSTAAMSKRLSAHCRRLALHIVEKRLCSVEIVIAFMICIPWMSFREHWADDETCRYLSMALTIALDLSLNKIVTDIPFSFGNARIARSDCLDARRALDMDGFPDVDVASQWGRRLLRRRERTWLSLFVLERGVCLARGRSYTLPMSPLIAYCDQWHISDIADTWDGSIVSVAVLRRDLAGLIDRIRGACDIHEVNGTSSQVIVDSIQGDINSFFDNWFKTWPHQLSEQGQVPPYVEILVCHTRLSTYSSVINHPTAPLHVKHFFRAAGLSAALNVMRAAVQGESRLKSMPNNTAIMISFAACFALRLGTMIGDDQSSLAPSIRSLIEETADVLERIGSTPAHREGASAIFAKHLRRISQNPPLPSITHHPSEGISSSAAYLAQPTQQNELEAAQSQSMLYPNQPFIFSGMSNNQINEAVHNAGVGLEATWADFHFDDGAGLDWLEWPG